MCRTLVEELGLEPQDVVCVSKAPLPALISQCCKAASLHVLTLPPDTAENAPGSPSADHMSHMAAVPKSGPASGHGLTYANGRVAESSGEDGLPSVRHAWAQLAVEAQREYSGRDARACSWVGEGEASLEAAPRRREAAVAPSGEREAVSPSPPAANGQETTSGSQGEAVVQSWGSRLAFLSRLVVQSQAGGEGGAGALVVGVVMKASRYAKLAGSGLLPLVARHGVCFQHVWPGRALQAQGRFHALLVKVSPPLAM